MSETLEYRMVRHSSSACAINNPRQNGVFHPYFPTLPVLVGDSRGPLSVNTDPDGSQRIRRVIFRPDAPIHHVRDEGIFSAPLIEPCR